MEKLVDSDAQKNLLRVSGPSAFTKDLFYLSTPYTHKDPSIRLLRYRQAVGIAGELLLNGLMVYSPIAHTHPIACAKNLPGEYDFWRRYNECLVSRCDHVIVAMMDGWTLSRGVNGEIQMALAMGKPVWYMPQLHPENIRRWVNKMFRGGQDER